MRFVQLIYFLFAGFYTTGQETFNRIGSFDLAAIANVAFEADNGYLIGGIRVDTTGGLHQKYFVLKLDYQGNEVSQVSYGNSDTSYKATLSPNVSLSDQRHVFAIKGYPAGTPHLMLVWLNDDGDTVKTRYYDNLAVDPHPDFPSVGPNAMKVDDQDNMYLLAHITQLTTINDAVLVKFNSEGDIQWIHYEANQAQGEWWYALGLDNTGVYIAGRLFESFEGYSELAKISFSGDELWRISLNQTGIEYNYPSDILSIGDDLLICGSGISGDFDPLYSGRQPVVYKIDTLGTPLWHQFFGMEYEDNQEFEHLIATCDGNYVTGARMIKEPFAAYDSTEGWSNQYASLVKFTGEGEILWERRFQYVVSTLDRHRMWDLIQTRDQGFLFCGDVQDQAQWGTEAGIQRAWVVKTDACGCLVPGCNDPALCSCPEPPLEITDYFIFSPNPVSDLLNVYLGANHPSYAELAIFDITGRQIMKFSVGDQYMTYMIPVASLAAGTYLLTLLDGDNVLQSGKWIKAN